MHGLEEPPEDPPDTVLWGIIVVVAVYALARITYEIWEVLH